MTKMRNAPALSRRQLLLGSGTLFAWAHMPKLAMAEGRDPRLLVIILRGALDGLGTVAPVGDPAWISLRGDKGLKLGGAAPALRLDDLFALNPAMPKFYDLYQAKQALIVHAVATPYRERSHFDGQDVLESGLPTPGVTDSGWLNRALTALEPAGRTAHKIEAFAVGPVTPLVVRGPAPILSWIPSRVPPAGQDTIMRLQELYSHTDQKLSQALEERIALAAIAGTDRFEMDRNQRASGPGAAVRSYFAEAAGAAAKFMSQPDGPRVGALAFDGWDTHADEGATNGRLSMLLGALDGAIDAIRIGMRDAWSDTVVVIATEFGRTARINGTEGTDHGTATMALLAGGAIKGGRVVADWPGLSPTNLYEGRDLKPTTDLRDVLKGILNDHLRVDPKRLATDIFPGTNSTSAMKGLV
jgi:uncharacterized protein (DUF1501 family)